MRKTTVGVWLGVLGLVGAAAPARALVVDVQGTVLRVDSPGATCVELAGEYRGFRVEASEAGLVPQICFSAGRVNVVNVLNATFVALPPAKQDILIKIEHDFPPGPNGKVMARARLNGFFSTPTGTGVPTGDLVKLKSFYVQGGKADPIGEPFDHKVAEDVESAVFDLMAKEPYLIAGERTLKAELQIKFAAPGHKLTLPQFTAVSVDSGSTFADKLDTLEIPEEDENPIDGAAPPMVPGEPGEPGATPLPLTPEAGPGDAMPAMPEDAKPALPKP